MHMQYYILKFHKNNDGLLEICKNSTERRSYHLSFSQLYVKKSVTHLPTTIRQLSQFKSNVDYHRFCLNSSYTPSSTLHILI